MSQPTDWLVPDWPAPARVRALCTTRAGGVSRAPFDHFNLGGHVGDGPAAVRANRIRLAACTGAQPVFLQQVHGTQVATLDAAPAAGAAAPEADAAWTLHPGIACTVMVADCLPVLFADSTGRAVAAAHAGWRGLAGSDGRGILESVLERFRALAPTGAAQPAIEIIAWLGPCIGPEAFEVGPDVRDAFAAPHRFLPRAHGRWLADLPGLARDRLHAAGVSAVYGNDGSAPWCTVANPSRFFSHRRDSARLGGSGRFAACVWMEGTAA